MPWRLVLFLIALTLVVFFAGFNLTNVSDISFGFYTFEDVPVFISLFIAFLMGTLVMLPFSVGKRQKKELKQKKSQNGAPKELPVFDVDAQVPENGRKTKKKKERKQQKPPILENDDTTM